MLGILRVQTKQKYLQLSLASQSEQKCFYCVCVAPLFAYSASLTVSMNLVRPMTRADVQRQLTVSAGRTHRLSSLSAQARQCFFSNIISTKYSLVLHWAPIHRDKQLAASLAQPGAEPMARQLNLTAKIFS